MKMAKVMKCPKCGYEWIPRVKNPKKCPRCGKWLQDWRKSTEVKRNEEASFGDLQGED